MCQTFGTSFHERRGEYAPPLVILDDVLPVSVDGEREWVIQWMRLPLR
jgi:hypothetical protein